MPDKSEKGGCARRLARKKTKVAVRFFLFFFYLSPTATSSSSSSSSHIPPPFFIHFSSAFIIPAIVYHGTLSLFFFLPFFPFNLSHFPFSFFPTKSSNGDPHSSPPTTPTSLSSPRSFSDADRELSDADENVEGTQQLVEDENDEGEDLFGPTLNGYDPLFLSLSFFQKKMETIRRKRMGSLWGGSSTYFLFLFLLFRDYKENPELDRYDSDVDDRDYAEMDPRKRAEVEAALRRRDVVEGKLPDFMKDGT